jgi:hypothetical protein
MADRERVSMVEEAKAIVASSHIPASDKKLLEGRIPFVADVMLAMFVQICREDPFSIDTVVKSLKKKLEAQGNLKKLHAIVKQERKEIEDAMAMG